MIRNDKHSKIWAGFIACLLCVITLTSCGSSTNKLKGQWSMTDGSAKFSTIEFFSDGTYTSNHANYNGNYSVDGDRIKLTGILVEPLTYSYKVKSDILTFYDSAGNVLATFAKQ